MKISDILKPNKDLDMSQKIWRLDSNIESITSNNTNLNIVKMLDNFLMHIIEIQNLIVTLTRQKGLF